MLLRHRHNRSSNQSNIISFTITYNNSKYTFLATSGMHWKLWISSLYNSSINKYILFIKDDVICIEKNKKFTYKVSYSNLEELVDLNDAIIKNYNYSTII